MIDFTLTSEQELIQKTAREFAKEHLAPGVIERDDKAEFPTEQIKVMGELGFMGSSRIIFKNHYGADSWLL